MILFTSLRPLDRAENIKAVYDAYDGEKEFAQYGQVDLHSGKYALQVGDELPTETVGKFLFIGHAMGAGKLYGLERKWFTQTELITRAIASSDDMVAHTARITGLDKNQIVPLGMPRTDAYFKRQKKHSSKKNYLYVPTFRGYDWWVPEWCSIQLYGNEEFIVKPHPVTGKLMKEQFSNIIEADSMIPSADFLIDSDVVITDYSSIMFDAFVLRKPVVLFAKDRFKYQRLRRMFYAYPDGYSQYFSDEEHSMMNMVRYAKWTDRFEELREFYAGACDGRSTERVIELIKSMI